MLNSDADSRTCFNGGNPCSSESESLAPNSSVATAFSSAQTTSNLGQITNISARAEADPLPAGTTAPPSFAAVAGASVSLDYHFEIVGPQNISQVPIVVMANMNITVSGSPAGSDSYGSSAQLQIGDGGQPLVNTELFLQLSSTNKSGSFSIDKTEMLDTNTPYEVFMEAGGSVALSDITDSAPLIATASIDPSFQLASNAPSGFSIVFADGIGDTPSTTPLPTTLPLFAGGLGFIGYLTRRKKRDASPAPLRAS